MHTSHGIQLISAFQSVRSASRRQFLTTLRSRAQQQMRLEWVARARQTRVAMRDRASRKERAFQVSFCGPCYGSAAAAA